MQGWHHVAQKSTTTTFPRSSSEFSTPSGNADNSNGGAGVRSLAISPSEVVTDAEHPARLTARRLRSNVFFMTTPAGRIASNYTTRRMRADLSSPEANSET